MDAFIGTIKKFLPDTTGLVGAFGKEIGTPKLIKGTTKDGMKVISFDLLFQLEEMFESGGKIYFADDNDYYDSATSLDLEVARLKEILSFIPPSLSNNGSSDEDSCNSIDREDLQKQALVHAMCVALLSGEVVKGEDSDIFSKLRKGKMW